MLSPSFPQRAPWGTANKLRAWQQEALEQYFAADQRDFLVAATPGAGKTTFALTLAVELMRSGEINRIIVARAAAGRRVVRLKGGDPFVFGRGGEEMLSCLAAGIPVDVTPGISSAIAVPQV